MRRAFSVVLAMVVLLLCAGCNTNGADDNAKHDDINANSVAEGGVNINLDQIKLLVDAEAFISLSSNDDSGYNRWLVFYFNLQTDEDYAAEDTLSYLEQEISNATLSTADDEKFFTTDKLIWTSTKSGEKNYNLVLTLIPDIGEFIADDCVNIESITLTTNTDKMEYDLPGYYVQTKKTLNENICYVSNCPFDAQFSYDYESKLAYRLTAAEGYQITAAKLVYSPIFSITVETEDVALTKESPYEDADGEGVVEENGYNDYYAQVSMSFSSLDRPVLFRPFIWIAYTDAGGNAAEGYVVPSLPANIHL